MAITTTGSFIQQHASGAATVNFTVANAGDLCVLAASTNTNTITVTGCSGNNSMGTFDSTANISDAGAGGSLRLFWATAAATGTTTMTVTYSGSISGVNTQYDGWMFTAGLGAGTVWAVDGTQKATLLSSGTTFSFPSLTASGSGELYVGCGVPTSTGSAGSTSGFSYNVDTGFTNVFCYNTNASGTLAPTAGDSSSGNTITVGALITAKAGGLSPLIVTPPTNRARLVRASCF